MSDLEKTRLRIARHLWHNGPQFGEVAALALGISLEQWWDGVTKIIKGDKSHKWFRFDKPGAFGWCLTEKGLREAILGIYPEASHPAKGVRELSR